MGQHNSKDLINSDSTLAKAQNMKMTASGLPICKQRTDKILTKKELENMRLKTNISPDVRIILNPPFSLVDRITDSLYLTGVGGLTIENLTILKITCIINATHEMPLATIKGVVSVRVPVSGVCALSNDYESKCAVLLIID